MKEEHVDASIVVSLVTAFLMLILVILFVMIYH